MRNNRGAIDISILVALVISLAIMFGLPLYITAQKHDNAIELSVQSATDELVNQISISAKITQQDLDNYQLTVDSTEYHWEYEVTIQKQDPNRAKITVSGTNGKVYITMYDTQVRDALAENGEIDLSPGDQVTIVARNVTSSISDELSSATLGSSSKKASDMQIKSSAMVSGQGN